MGSKPVIERTLGSVSTLFAQYVAGYVGRSTEHRGKVWTLTELHRVERLTITLLLTPIT